VPFLFVQLACWPTGAAANMLSSFRYAQARQQAQQPRTGMVVSADLCDPAGPFHPIHPVWKEEVARRAFLWADAEVYGNESSPRGGPSVVAAPAWDAWDSSWGDFHFGTGANSYVCASTGQFGCGGIRLRFDRPVALRSFFVPPPAAATDAVYGFAQGASSGFALAQNGSLGAWSQPVVLTSVSADGLTAQLNVTWIGPEPTPQGGVLYYAWGDYPTAMPLVDAASGVPVAPFNITLPFPPRPSSGNCTYVADTDGSAGGVVVPGTTREECCAACWADPRCSQVAFNPAAPTDCWLKYGTGTVPAPGVVLCVLDLGEE